jgi:hypothetical protein
VVEEIRTVISPGGARRAARGRGVEWLGRLGLVAKGITYVIVAVLALAVALGETRKPEDRQGALQRIAGEAWGKPLLIVLAIGFVAYVAWRLAQAFFDRENEGGGAKGLAKRAASLGKAAIYAGLLFVTIKILLDAGSSGSSGEEKQATAAVLGWPAGTWIVGLAGVAIIGAGIFNAYRAVSQSFEDDLDTHEMSEAEERWYGRVGTLGHAARAVVFGLVGSFLIKAALEYDPKEAIGLDEALAKVAGQTAGPYLLGLTAAGLLCYGLFCFVQARYRRV